MNLTDSEHRRAADGRQRWQDVLLRPGRLGTIAFVLAVAVVCVLLGRWQLSRLQERRDLNDAIASRSQLPPLGFADLVTELSSGVEVDDLEFRRVELTGTWLTAQEVLQRNRSHEGRQGFHVITPLDVTDGTGVLVRRGWVPVALDEPPVAQAAPPTGTVTVTGLVRAPERFDGFGPRDPEDGELVRLFWADPERLDAQTSIALVDVVIDLESQEPPTASDVLEPLPPVQFDEANHLSYAIQWFSFAVIAIVGLAAYARSRWFSTPPS